MTGQADRFFGDLFADTADLKDDSPRFDDCYVVIDCTLTTTHTCLCRLGCNRLIGEDADPHFAAALHKTGQRDTGRFDLAGLQPAGLEGLQAILSESDSAAALSSPFHTTAMLLAVFIS